jgi:CRP/FNR family transcriptional regulator
MSADVPMDEIWRRLSWVGFLSHLPEGELFDLAQRADFVRLGGGEQLVVGPEEQAQRTLILLAGQAQDYVLDPSGRELTLSVLASGSAVDATGIVARRSRDLRLRALEPSVVCRVGREELEALVLVNPLAALELARMLAERLVWMEGRWAAAARAVPARLAGVLLMLVESEGVMTPDGPMIPTRYTHHQLASMIGSNREAVTRAFSKLREGGGVEVRGRRVYVTDPDALARASGG